MASQLCCAHDMNVCVRSSLYTCGCLHLAQYAEVAYAMYAIYSMLVYLLQSNEREVPIQW